MTSQYGKFEANFSITGTTATNLQVPYDAAPPLGVTAGYGVTVDVLFLAPGATDWSQATVWPAYWHQPVTLAMIGSQQQGIVTGSGTWKVRAQLQQQGSWQARWRAIDGNGTTLGTPSTFTVTAPAAGSHGPLRVSSADTSVFEFADGTAYWPVGVNGDNTSTLDPKYTSNINLSRIWFSNQCLIGSNHGDNIQKWVTLNVVDFDHVCQPTSAGAPTTLGFRLISNGSLTVAINTFNASSAAAQAFLSCKRSTTYRFSCWINTSGLSGTGVVTAKLGPFFSAANVTAGLAGITDTRRVITTTAGSAPTTWTQFTGTYTTGAAEDWFGGGTSGTNPYLYLALEGSTTGYAEIAQLQIQENLGAGVFGPNQVDLANGYLDQYSQLGSAVVDSIVADAESKGIAIKAVLEDKGDVSWHYFNADGTITFTTSANGNIYNDLNTSQTGWYQKAFARYLTARWGYSNAIHSWEHVNEGDGGSAQQTFTDQLASYFKSIDPNKHMVGTSTAAGINATFWAAMTNVDYVDNHESYTDTGDEKTADWQLPLVDNNGTNHFTFVSAGIIQLDCSLTTNRWSLPCVVQEAGVWTVSCDVNATSTLGGTVGFTGPGGLSQLIAPGTTWTTLTGTFTQASATLASVNFLIGAGTHTGGTAQFRNWSITSPSGKRIFTFIGDGTFPTQTDTSLDTAAFHTTYDRYLTARATVNSEQGQGVGNRPVMRGEWGPGSSVSGPPAGLSSDTNFVYLHTFLFAGLASGNLYECQWTGAPFTALTTTALQKYGQFLSFVSGIPINSGHYQDINATLAGQTNGAVVLVGQKDTVNNKAHFWVRHNKFTWGNAVNNPTAWVPGSGTILTGTATLTGFTPSTSLTATTWEYDATGALTKGVASVTSDVSGNVVINLATIGTLTSTTDMAVTLAPGGTLVSGGYFSQYFFGPVYFTPRYFTDVPAAAVTATKRHNYWADFSDFMAIAGKSARYTV